MSVIAENKKNRPAQFTGRGLKEINGIKIEQHILPHLGEYEIDNLTAYIIQKFIVGLSDNGLAFTRFCA